MFMTQYNFSLWVSKKKKRSHQALRFFQPLWKIFTGYHLLVRIEKTTATMVSPKKWFIITRERDGSLTKL